MDLCDKVMSLLFNTLPRSVIAFFLTSKPILISWLHSLSPVILEPRKIKSVTASTFSPSVCREVMRLDAMILVFWMLSVKPAFSLSSFTLSPMVFPVVTYGCKSWTVKKVEHKKFMLLNCGAGKTLERPLNCKEIKGDQGLNLKGNQPWKFTERTDGEAEAPVLWPPDAKSRLIGKDPDAGKDWGWEERGTTEDKMVGWHHWLNGHEFKQTPGGSKGQWSLVCWWGHKSQTPLSDWTTTRLGQFDPSHPSQNCSTQEHVACCAGGVVLAYLELSCELRSLGA